MDDGDRDIKLGERGRSISNLDTSVNVYDRVYVAHGENIVDAWPSWGARERCKGRIETRLVLKRIGPTPGTFG